MTEPSRFHALHQPGRPLFLPNAWDFTSAALLIDAGFPAIGTTSLGVAAANGIPDAHGVALAETLALARKLGQLGCLYTVDVEGGFSDDPAEVAELAAHLDELGAAGINLEDGRPDGTLRDPVLHRELIAAVKQRVPTMFVNARTDTFWLGVGGVGATIDRAAGYVGAGADGVFVPAVAVDTDIEHIASSVGAPLNVLYLPGKHSIQRLGELGVARISTGSLLFRAALHATIDAARVIRDGGDITAPVPGYAEIQRLIGVAH